MMQSDTLTLLGLGIAVLFGALQVSPRNRFLWLFILGGWIIVALGCGKLLWDLWQSHPLLKLLIGASVVSLGVIAATLAMEAYRSTNIGDYIFLWERNAQNWDNSSGKSDTRVRLSEAIRDGIAVPVVLRLPQQKCPAKFTPVVETQYDSLELGTELFIFIQGKGLVFDDNKLKEWRPVLTDTTNGQKYWGVVDQPIHYGKSKKGPDGIIQVHFPVGKYRVDYTIQGESRKGCSFSKEGYFFVEIYDGGKPSSDVMGGNTM